jgi:2-polyprenyl-6-methoxyphenol hydroxylase-like FAD-dependent oxidoreductase
VPGWGRRAIGVGAGLAGLLAARVLATRFDEVLLVERDDLAPDASDVAAARKGVPQGRHVHNLLPRGGQTLERLFPGITREMEAAGAIPVDVGADLRWFHFGGYKRRFRTGLQGMAQSRPWLEGHVRRRCLALGNLRLRQGWEVRGLLASHDRSAIVGVELRPLHGGLPERVDADLVVDASGRGSQAGQWLEALGYARPPASVVRVDVRYTSRLYRRRAGDPGGDGAKLLLVYARPPAGRRVGAAFPIEGDRWIVTQGGWLGEQAPADEAGFLAYARSLPAPDLYDLLREAEPVSGFAVHRFPANQWHHYERLRRFPLGFLVLGDALCSFNPIYGQGMTVAALEAEALDGTMAALEAEGRGLEVLPHAFFGAAARTIRAPWRLAVGEDFRFSSVAGPKPSGTRLFNWYAGKVYQAANADQEVCRAFLRMTNLTSPPWTLLRPGIARRVIRHWLLGGHPRD